jgi:hypothetical protein
MTQNPTEPARLAGLSSERDLLGVAPLVRAAASPLPEITPTARRRIRGRLYAELSGHARIPHRSWRPAVIVLLALAVGGAVGAATHAVVIKRRSAPGWI